MQEGRTAIFAFRIAADMAGHAGINPYIQEGYEIITL